MEKPVPIHQDSISGTREFLVTDTLPSVSELHEPLLVWRDASPGLPSIAFCHYRGHLFPELTSLTLILKVAQKS